MAGPPAVATLKDLCLDALDPVRVGVFWGQVLGRAVDDAGRGDGVTPDVVLRGEPTLWVNGVAEAKQEKLRLHLDVDLGPGRTTGDLVALGARVLHEPRALAEHQSWWVLADPEGNEFCAFAP